MHTAANPAGPGQRADANRKSDPRRILVAEDHEINRHLITSVLEKEGYAFAVAGDGMEAFEMIEAAHADFRPFSLVLMDIQMPRLDGLAATRAIRDAGHTSSALPILAITANAFASDVEDCLEAGMQGHLSKPVNLQQLREALSDWLPRDRGADGDTTMHAAVEGVRKDYEAFKAATRQVLEKCNVMMPHPGQEHLNELRAFAHQLAGTAGMFGEAELGRTATDIENRVVALDTAPDTALLQRAIRAALDQIGEVARGDEPSELVSPGYEKVSRTGAG